MKLIDGLKLKGAGTEIPDCSRDDLPEFFKEMGFKVGVEVGVATGSFSIAIAKAGLKVYGIDPFLEYEDFDHPNICNQKRLDRLYWVAQKRCQPYDITIIRKTSMEAAKDFKNDSIDFVFIDGHHGFKYVAEDLWEWTKKVKKGGIVAGHDYALNKKAIRDPFCLHVPHVVNAFTDCFRIDNWYVLGERVPKKGEHRDKWRSWMFVNPEI